MGLQVLALACLVGAIILGFVRKMNVGIVCFGLALILGTIGGMASERSMAAFRINCLAHCWEPCYFSVCCSKTEHWKKFPKADQLLRK